MGIFERKKGDEWLVCDNFSKGYAKELRKLGLLK